MFPQKLVGFFLPADIRHSKTHPRYHEFYTMASPILAGVLFIALVPLPLMIFHVGSHIWLYLLNAALNFLTLLSMRWLGHYRFFNILSGVVSYFIIYTWLDDYGLIYSPNMCVVHMYLLAAVLTDKKWGWIGIFTNILFIIFIYYRTIHDPSCHQSAFVLGSPAYVLAMHIIITIFLGGFLASSMRTQEGNRKQISHLQDLKIGMLDEAVRRRTQQLNSMRQTISSDFHDQTGNMLAAITRQAATLELKLYDRPDVLPLVKSIIINSDELYASSKDFLWNLNHDSDNPHTLFQYLADYGQRFYNQFDISFSVSIIGTKEVEQQLNPFAALNLIYIFKEAMSNVVKHSGAEEVVMTMSFEADRVIYELSDNGKWLDPDLNISHYGISNMKRRSGKSGFDYDMTYSEYGTKIKIQVPFQINFIVIEATEE